MIWYIIGRADDVTHNVWLDLEKSRDTSSVNTLLRSILRTDSPAREVANAIYRATPLVIIKLLYSLEIGTLYKINTCFTKWGTSHE